MTTTCACGHHIGKHDERRKCVVTACTCLAFTPKQQTAPVPVGGCLTDGCDRTPVSSGYCKHHCTTVPVGDRGDGEARITPQLLAHCRTVLAASWDSNEAVLSAYALNDLIDEIDSLRSRLAARGVDREALAKAFDEAADEVAALVPYGYGMNPDGTEDRMAMAYVEGHQEAWQLLRNRARAYRGTEGDTE